MYIEILATGDLPILLLQKQINGKPVTKDFFKIVPMMNGAKFWKVQMMWFTESLIKKS
jgi:hypothetical protein